MEKKNHDKTPKNPKDKPKPKSKQNIILKNKFFYIYRNNTK